ncbi:MAG: cyclic nucleotide-binding domain-containing protein [bacterium]
MLFADIIINISNGLYLVASGFKKIIYLRIALVFAGLLEIWYFWLAAPDDLLASILWGILFVLINMYMIGLYIYERKSLALKDDEAKLFYMVFQKMEKVLFKKLMKAGHWISCPLNSILIKENEPTNTLLVLFEGKFRIEIEKKPITILNPGSFLGEISFLAGGNATATAISETESRLYCWDKKSLLKLLNHNPNMDVEMMKIFSSDLVNKLIQSNK